MAASGLRERDPDAYRQRNFELSVAGYFADPTAAHDLTPFRVTGRVQQSVWESLGDFDLLAPGQLDSVHVPTLVVHGRQDPIPIASSEAAAHAHSAPSSWPIDHSGHVPYVEQPDALFSAIRSFLGELAMTISTTHGSVSSLATCARGFVSCSPMRLSDSSAQPYISTLEHLGKRYT